MIIAQSPVVVANTMHNQFQHKASDKRRAQNRAAQKTYREKKKRRLETLENLAASAGLLETNDVTQQSQSQQQITPGDVSDTEAGADLNSRMTLPPFLQHVYQDTSIQDREILADDFPQKALDMPIRILELQEPGRRLEDSISDTDFIWPGTTTENLSNALTLSSPEFSMSSSSSSCSSPLQMLDHLQSSDTALVRKGCNSLDRSIPPSLSDPAANQIWFETTSTYAAYIRIVGHLGIQVPDPCVLELDSPFYTPTTPESGDTDALVQIVQNSFSHLKPDLRPSRIQILIKHPAYLDVLPFPELRDRLIEMLTHDPPLLDEKEFCADVESGGVVCWGSVAPGGEITAGGGAPWDSRSWEAKTWFLNKWNWLIGEDSLLARNSEWWRLMRGHQQGINFF